MPRESKIHYSEAGEHGKRYAPPCGTDGRSDSRLGTVTCVICWWHILAATAPWARQLLVDLRAGAGPRKGPTVRVPRAPAEPVGGQVTGLGNGFARAFSQQLAPEKRICGLLPELAAGYGPIQEVMDYSRAAANAVGVQKGQVAEQAGDAGQVGDEAHGDFQPPI